MSMSAYESDGSRTIASNILPTAALMLSARWKGILLVTATSLAWLLPGLTGREPWKPDEAYTLGIIYHFYQSHDWLVPMLGGEPFMEKPPLFFWTAALFGHLFTPMLALIDAVRLATFFYVGLTLLFLSLTARELYGPRIARFAPLVFLGCLGLLYRGHELLTDNALLTGFAIAWYGVALSLRRLVVGGLLLGAGAGIGFMCKGLIAPGILGIAFLLLPLIMTAYRRREWCLTATAALLMALPWLLLWPWLLYERSPVLFHDWFWTNNFDRFLHRANMGGSYDPSYYFKEMPWITLPALPLALYTLWRKRGAWHTPPIALPLISALVIFAVLQLSRAMSDVYTLPLLLPLSLLGAVALVELPSSGARILNGSAWLLFGMVAALLWGGRLAEITDYPIALLTYLGHWLPAGSTHLKPGFLLIACAYTVMWLSIGALRCGSGERALLRWAGGTALVWCLVMTLWLPALNASKSYRTMMMTIREVFPRRYDCVATWGLGDSERAMLSYYNGIDTKPFYVRSAIPNCQVLIVQTENAAEPGFDDWRMIWSGSRPTDNSERLWLLERTTPPASPALARTVAVSYGIASRRFNYSPAGPPHHGNRIPP